MQVRSTSLVADIAPSHLLEPPMSYHPPHLLEAKVGVELFSDGGGGGGEGDGGSSNSSRRLELVAAESDVMDWE